MHVQIVTLISIIPFLKQCESFALSDTPALSLTGTAATSISNLRRNDRYEVASYKYSKQYRDPFATPSKWTPSTSLHASAPTNKEVLEKSNNSNDDTNSTNSLDLEQYQTSIQDGFPSLAAFTALALLESERKRHILEKNSASNWLDDESVMYVKQLYDKLELKLADQRSGLDRDEAGMWIRWMKASPSPTIIELTEEFRSAANETLGYDFLLERLQMTDMANIDDLFARMGLRLILLPSGSELNHPIVTPAGSVIYGKLLYGGVQRYRLSSSSANSPRKTSQKTILKATANDHIPAWVQYGGPPRTYEALDMGPAAILEIVMQPRFTKVSNLFTDDRDMDMSLSRLLWSPHNMFSFQEQTENSNYPQEKLLMEDNTAISLSGMDRNQAFEKSFQSSVGGLQPQIQAIVRRVLDGRIIRPAEDDISYNTTTTDSYDSTMTSISEVALEAEELALLGLSPVKGLLLYGPPGCGKTALAREISKSLKARSPRIVSAPELLDRWVGGSEKLVRELFAPAEAELASVNYDASKSALHVIVIDEIDAVFRTRSTAEDSGESTRSSVVNQILAKLDGVNSIPNVLLIGMTNRRELLDEALLRPGRLEVQIEIPLPNKEGRREILQIHFDALRKRGRLSLPLCHAIDGISFVAEEAIDEVQSDYKRRKRDTIVQALHQITSMLPQRATTFDLASDSITAGFSGADLAGLVRCAGSIALSRAREDGGGVESLVITLEDVKQALLEVSK